jgi:hypothetical protein
MCVLYLAHLTLSLPWLMELMGESGWKLVSALPSHSSAVTALANGARGARQLVSGGLQQEPGLPVRSHLRWLLAGRPGSRLGCCSFMGQAYLQNLGQASKLKNVHSD